jgi:ABC-2 type transport system ATP-binding protein
VRDRGRLVLQDSGFCELMPPLVLAQHVTKWYGPRRAVNDVSFAIERGEIVGLLGPNGSGKSTIFRMLTGYLVPTSGHIEIAGHDVVSSSLEVRRVISYVPEDAPLYDHMRVGEFLHFMASLRGLRGRAAKAAVDAAAERLDLTRVMMLLTAKLSRGFRQRVSIAQALLGNPQVLVLDEPTSGLDPHQVIAVRDLIQSLSGSHTVLIASHILPEIEKIASRVMILLDGTLLTADALRGEAAGTVLRLAAVAPEATVRSVVSAIAGVRDITIERDLDSDATHYLIKAEPRVTLAADIVAALVKGGVAVSELTEARPDLERVFLDLTRRSSRAAA